MLTLLNAAVDGSGAPSPRQARTVEPVPQRLYAGCSRETLVAACLLG